MITITKGNRRVYITLSNVTATADGDLRADVEIGNGEALYRGKLAFDAYVEDGDFLFDHDALFDFSISPIPDLLRAGFGLDASVGTRIEMGDLYGVIRDAVKRDTGLHHPEPTLSGRIG